MPSAAKTPRTSKEPAPAASAMSALNNYEVHEAAELFPMIDEHNLNELAADIAAHGQQEPIWLYQGKLLDGRNRVVACAIAGVQPLAREWKPKQGETPATFVMSRNLHRRHLTKSQRATLAVELSEVLAAERAIAKSQKTILKDPFSHKADAPVSLTTAADAAVRFTSGPSTSQPRIGQKVRPGRVRDQAAQALEVSAGYVNDAKDLKKADPDTYAKVRSGELTIARAQDQVVAEAKQQGTLDQVKLRPGAIRAAMQRLEAENRPKRPHPKPAIRLPKATKVQSSATTVSITATFGNRTIAEDWLNRMQEDKKVLDLDFEVLDKRPRKRKRDSH